MRCRSPLQIRDRLSFHGLLIQFDSGGADESNLLMEHRHVQKIFRARSTEDAFYLQ